MSLLQADAKDNSQFKELDFKFEGLGASDVIKQIKVCLPHDYCPM